MAPALPRWLLVGAVLSLAFVNPHVRGDGNGYYAWLVSAVVDHDLDFRNQYARAEPLFRDRYLDERGVAHADRLTPTGHVENQWSVGPALMWTPWFLVAHAAVHIGRAFGWRIAADGYSWPYRWACAIGTAVYGWVAMALAWRIAMLVGASARASQAAALAIWAAGPLPVYQFFLPFHVHALAACVVACFLWWWLAHVPAASVVTWAGWGAIGGLMTSVYHLNAVVLLIVPVALEGLRRSRGGGRAALCAGAFALAAVVAWVPQFLGKAIVYGTPFTTGYHDRFDVLSPHLWQTAFSANHGLFTWSPVLLVATLGLMWLARARRDAFVMSAVFVAFFCAVASYENWHGLSSFGNRLFISLTAVFVVGLAAVAGALDARGPAWRRAGQSAIALLAIWNAGLAFQWGTSLIPTRGAIDFSVAARQQVTVVPVRLAQFVERYFTARDAAVRAAEQKDLQEWIALHPAGK